GPWTGDLLGFAAQPTQKFVDVYMLKEVTPTVGFFTKGVVDLRWKFTPDDEQKLAAARDKAAHAANPIDRFTASADVEELELQKERARRAAAYAKHIDEWPELKYRFQRDSLYQYLRDKYHNTTDQQFEAWWGQWLQNNLSGATNALVVSKILDPSSTQPISTGDMPMEHGLKVTPQPIPIGRLHDRAKDDLERARKLTNTYDDMEKRRLAASQRNLQEASALYRAENVGLAVEKLKDDPQMENYLLALHYLAVPRAVPVLKTVIYNVDSSTASTDDNSTHVFQVATQLDVDPTLYYPDNTAAAENGADVSNQYYIKNSFLDPASLKGSPASADNVPLLQSSQEALSALLQDHDKDITAGRGVVVITSAFANDMADLSNALPATYMHLPSARCTKVTWTPGKNGPLGAVSVDGKNRYLMAQTVGFVSTPPKAGDEYWYAMQNFPMPGRIEAGRVSAFTPIVKIHRQPGGALTGTCDYTVQFNGILSQTHMDVTGTLDDAKPTQLNISGKQVRSYPENGTIVGDTTEFKATLNSKPNYMSGGGGQMTYIFSYLNDKVPAQMGFDAKQTAEALKNTHKPYDVPYSSWSLELMTGEPTADDPKPLKGTWHSNIGDFTLDQWCGHVEGTIKYTDGKWGLVKGWTDSATSLTFEWYDSDNADGDASLSPSKDGKTWSGYSWPSRFHHETGKSALTLTR
ncbi:MAG: hypothetical protein JO353_10445, partial [Phycisphaerae bacterium]|nr:hypothetical protein [Phycisphaerae bacterium]